MRVVNDPQLPFGEVEMSRIEGELRSREELPKLRRGVHPIYGTPELRSQGVAILEELVPQGVDTKTGRPGMAFWKMWGLGPVRLNGPWDDDNLQERATTHQPLRLRFGPRPGDRRGT